MVGAIQEQTKMTDTSLIPTSALARELGVNRRTLVRWTQDPNFPMPKVFNRRLYFLRYEIETWKTSAPKLRKLEREKAGIKKDVYFIRSGPYIKIGVADDIPQRLKDLQIGNPEKLELLRVVKGGGHDAEKYFHSVFEKFHIRGEWFHWDKTMSTEKFSG
jgi:predicted DNA-binding transcriptional regulator AlpA